MGLMAQIDAELQKDLIDFVKAQEADQSPHTLGEALVKEILKDIINGNARISGCVTNHANKRMYLEFTFYEEDGDGKQGMAQQNAESDCNSAPSQELRS